jgi:DnaD and phage-associated domain
MYFEAFNKILYSDTMVPDVFITEYLPSLSSDSIKVYIYCLFLSKYDKQATIPEMSKNLNMDMDNIKSSLILLESLGVINKRDDGTLIFNDLKEKEINKLYRPKITSSPEEALASSDRNKKRNAIISAINNAFFQGVMPPSWYTDIDAWFDKYKFEEDVMYALFQHCYDHNGLSKNYIIKVADSWHSKKIVNSFDLDRYFMEYEKVKEIKVKISRKLKFNRMLTEYEQVYVEKWVLDYGYDFDIIEMALKRTTGKTNPSLEFVNTVITDWHNKGLKTCEEITSYLLTKKPASKQAVKGPAVPQHNNFKQREYDDEYYESLYENT